MHDAAHEPAEKSPRNTVLWQAYDLFQMHRSVSCPTCGQSIRDAGGEKKAVRLRHAIFRIFQDTVPQDFKVERGREQCATFVSDLARLAANTLSEDASQFITSEMNRFLDGMRR